MDENEVVQGEDRTKCTELLNTLLASLTVFERNVKILHWNYSGVDFVSVHPWLDGIHDDVCKHIDAVAEEIRKGGFFPAAELNRCIEASSVAAINASVPYGNAETMKVLMTQISAVMNIADALSTEADERKFWTTQDMANSILSDLSHHRYFVANSLPR